jgi:hypothetical protein
MQPSVSLRRCGLIHRCVAKLRVLYGLSLLVRMHPFVWRDLALLGQLDHVDRRRKTALAAVAPFERGLKLPQRRILRPATGIERHANPRLAPVALDLQPSQAALDALANRRAGLCGSAIAPFGLTRLQLRRDQPRGRPRWRAGGAASAFILAAPIRPPRSARDVGERTIGKLGGAASVPGSCLRCY